MKSHSWVAFVLLASSLFAQNVTEGIPLKRVPPGKGRIFGKVTDGADHAGLFGVTISVMDSNGEKAHDPIITDTDGTYRVDGLTVGTTYSVIYSKDDEGYALQERTVTATQEENLKLRKRRGSDAYLNQTAVTFSDDIKALAPEKQADGFAQAWEQLRSSGVSAESLAIIASKVSPRLANLKLKSPSSFVEYSNADPKRLHKAEEAFQSKSTPPDSTGISPMIYEDIGASERRNDRRLATEESNGKGTDISSPVIISKKPPINALDH